MSPCRNECKQNAQTILMTNNTQKRCDTKTLQLNLFCGCVNLTLLRYDRTEMISFAPFFSQSLYLTVVKWIEFQFFVLFTAATLILKINLCWSCENITDNVEMNNGESRHANYFNKYETFISFTTTFLTTHFFLKFQYLKYRGWPNSMDIFVFVIFRKKITFL